MNKNNLKKFFTRSSHKSNRLTVPEPINANREWSLGLVMTVLFVCAGGLMSYFFYHSVVSFSVSLNDSGVVRNPYVATTVDEATELFRQRNEAYQAIRGKADDLVEIVTPVVEESTVVGSEIIIDEINQSTSTTTEEVESVAASSSSSGIQSAW